MIREAENNVRIEGILSEVDLNYGSFKKKSTGETVNSIGGSIKVQVNQNINGETVMLEVPVHMFASEITNKGTKNPAYQNIEKIKNEFTSIAAAGSVQGADAIRITNGKIVVNEFPNRMGEISSYPRISASFVSKISQADMKPEATFTATFVVGMKCAEVNKDGVETGRYKVTGVLPQYGGKVDTMEFYATSPRVIDAITSYWENQKTYSAKGRLNFTSTTREIIEECDFGEPDVKYRTISLNELIVTKGTQSPLEDEMAFAPAELAAALKEHKAYIETLKDKTASKTKATPAPSGTSTHEEFDLGF